MNEAVVVEGLTVRYGRKAAVEGVSFSVPRGAVYALLGRNGAGKSSAVRCLLGQLRPHAGAVRVFGQDVWRHRRSAMARIGVVPEEPDLPPGMTARQLAAFCAPLYPAWDGDGFIGRLNRFGVPLGVPVARLSKGQKGQLGLALALAPGPELMILDDPTLGLDAVARRDFFAEVVGELADRGITIVVTTHDLAGVERIAERVGILKEGRLLVDETLEGLKGRFRRISDARGTEVVTGHWDALSLDRLRAERTAEQVEARALSLEEIFTELVGDEREDLS